MFVFAYLLLIGQKTVAGAPADYIARFHMFNSTYELYTHRYADHTTHERNPEFITVMNYFCYF